MTVWWVWIFQAFVFSFSFVYLTDSLPIKIKRSICFLILFCAYLIFYSPSTNTLLEPVIRYGKFILFYFFWALLFLKIEINYALFLSVFCTALMGTWFSCFQLLFWFLGIHNQNLLVLVSGFARILSVIFYKHKIIRIEEKRTIPITELLISILPAMSCFLANLVIYSLIINISTLSYSQNVLIFLLAVFFAVSTLAVLASTESYFKSVYLQTESRRSEDQLYLQYQLFLMEREKDEQLKALHHDMKNHLLVLNQLSKIEQVHDYVDHLKESVNMTMCLPDTGNPVLNVILNQKSKICNEKEIVFKVGISFNKADFLSSMEICTLFVNCLDNAIEATEQCEANQRRIELAGGWINECLVVRIQNTFINHPIIQDNQILTSKANKTNHGYGLKNVQDVLKNHHGTLTYKEENQFFVVTWMIPSPEND